ncbi:MAG TPA: FtsQ-type POTRA domain-containing protein [Natronosporangium sp.]
MSERGWRLVRAGTDAVPRWIRRFFRAPRPRRLRRRHWLSIVAAGLVVGAGGWLLWGTSVVGVREVRVTGTSLLSTAEVQQAAAVSLNTPLLRVRTGEVAERVAALPPVETVTVRRDWPSAVVIEVVERTGVAAVPITPGPGCDPDGDCFAVIDANGVVFQTVPAAGELPVVIVATPGPADPATRAALAVLDSLTPQLRADLESVAAPGPARIELKLRSGWTVVWGDESDSEAKAQVATALLDRDGEVIDVSAPEVVSIR